MTSKDKVWLVDDLPRNLETFRRNHKDDFAVETFARRLPLPTLNHGMTHSLIAKITSGGTSRNVVRDSSYNIGVARPVRWAN